MNPQPKNDWREIVLQKISRALLPVAQREEIIIELAAHLEEFYESALSRGVDGADALNLTFQEVRDWNVLAAKIHHAKSKEGIMSQHAKRLVLTTMAGLWVCGLFLVILDRAALLQRLIWIACMALLIYAAALEADRLNQRTRSFWLPGFITLSVAGLFLLASDFVCNFSPFFGEIALHPQDLVQWNSSSPRVSYLVWLLAQIAFGAIGGYFSGRAGGTRIARILAGTFPATIIVGTYVLMVPVTSLITGKAFNSPLPAYLGSAALVWIVAPTFSVALGAARFLRQANVALSPQAEG